MWLIPTNKLRTFFLRMYDMWKTHVSHRMTALSDACHTWRTCERHVWDMSEHSENMIISPEFDDTNQQEPFTNMLQIKFF